MRLDPPCVISAAVKRSVRRWRTARIAVTFPHFAHYTTTRLHAAAGPVTTPNRNVFDHARVLGRALRDIKSGKALHTLKSPQQTAAMLISAISGGQWPQVRLAGTRRFTDDNRCQLCLSNAGTLIHRYACPATAPQDGWTHQSLQRSKLDLKLDDDQLHTFTTRVVALHFLPVPPRVQGETLSWLVG